MNLSKTLVATALLTLPLSLTGCGGSSSEGGNDSDNAQYYQFGGAVQKGPLQPGSVVTIHELNKDFEATGITYTTQIEDYEGNYNVNERFNSQYAELVAQGYYFNELTGNTDEQMSMSAFVDVHSSTNVNFNVATSAMKDSIMAKVKSGESFDVAVRSVTEDLLNLYSYSSEQWAEGINFYQVNLSNAGDTSTMLLVISASTLKMATDNGLTLEQQIQAIGQVLVDPKSAEFDELQKTLSTYSLALYETEAYHNTWNYFTDNGLSFDIPHIDYFIDIDGDGQLPNKELPVFSYTAGITTHVSEDSIGNSFPAGVTAVDYQGRPMTFEFTGEFKYGEIESVNYTDSGVSFIYKLTDTSFEGTVTDCVTVNTVLPAPANFSYDACITLITE